MKIDEEYSSKEIILGDQRLRALEYSGDDRTHMSLLSQITLLISEMTYALPQRVYMGASLRIRHHYRD